MESILSIFSFVLKLVLALLIFFIVLEVLSFLLWFYYYKVVRKFEMPENISKYKAKSIFYRLLYEFPKQFWLDRFNRKPGEFLEYGVHLICGEQGSGKTTSVVDLLLNRWQMKYPYLKVYSNMDYKYQNGKIKHWKDLMDKKRDNGIYGVVNVIDEIQGWFSSLQSKDFPVEMLREISQQRKQRKVILGTAQVFGRIGKPLREQCSFVYLPFTVFGCLTFVRVSKPIYYDETTFTFKKYIKTYFFVHTPKLRNSFDTYEKIEGYMNEGFKTDLERNNNN